MKIIIASDHAGFELKQKLIEFLKEKEYEVEDMGPFEFNKLDDYPDYIIPAAEKVAENLNEYKGIILGGSGQGEAISANKVKGIRAAVLNCNNMDLVELSRIHNDANILSIGARFLSEDEAKKAIKMWLETKFSNDERHQRRIDKISKFEGQ